MDDPSKKRRLPFALDPGPWDALPGGSVATALVPRSARVDGDQSSSKSATVSDGRNVPFSRETALARLPPVIGTILKGSKGLI